MLKPFRLLYGLIKESWNYGKQEHAVLLRRNEVCVRAGEQTDMRRARKFFVRFDVRCATMQICSDSAGLTCLHKYLVTNPCT